MPEQRTHPRVDASRIVVRIPNAERFRTMYLHDLSRGGLFVKTDKRLQVGEEVTVELWPPEWKDALVLEARVVRWQDAVGDLPAGLGMEFDDLTKDAARRLDQLIEEYQEEAEDEFVESRVTGLIGELDAARRRAKDLADEVARLRQHNHELEQDEANLRTVAEKLATEKAAAERRAQESVASLTKRLEEVDAERMKLARQVDKLKGETAELRDSLTRSERDSGKTGQELSELKAKVEEQAAAAQFQRERADYLAGEVEKRRTKERDLRKLLSAIGSGSQTPSRPTPPPDAPEPELQVRETPAAGDDVDVEVDEEDAVPESFGDFAQRLKKSTRLIATDRLAKRAPKDDAEALVTKLLQAGPTMQTLLNQVEGKIGEVTLQRLLYDLHEAEQLELRG